ncbi:PTS sugar transporter subunit IIA [Desulfovibrio aminophilus]|uniref:PTS sugar transporter subunit IIA n=1 Tax=Desulfovibrio aminophilus TaxID=81425 RepID=UPI0033939BD5
MANNERIEGKHIGVVLVTHGNFGEALLEAASLVLGPQEGCRAVNMAASAGMEELVEGIKAAVSATDHGAGVLVMTDLFGGTPTTLSLSLCKSAALEVITGVNLPMLLKVLQSRNQPLVEISAQAKKAGQQGIVVAGEILRRNRAEG